MSRTRFCFYGRLSTTDLQDATLSFPSQREACEKAIADQGEVVCQFTDEESGAKDDRPGWTELMHEARDRRGRRFDGVVLYSTSRLARDRYLAALYERELRKVGVNISYATGAGDPSTPEGKVLIALQQAFDEYERGKLSRETKRGMKESARQGWRCGGRAPYGYRREFSDHPVAARARSGERKARLVPEPEQAEVIAEIFHLYVDKRWGFKAIADYLNRPGGPPSPSHVDASRNTRGDWAKSTIRELLRNPVFTGRSVWNRRDFASQRETGGTARLRAEDEWVVSEVEHQPLVSDELFAQVQERFRGRANGAKPRNGSRSYLFSGMVRCASGHPSRAMYGKRDRGITYCVCAYGRDYGPVAADEIEGHGRWLRVREDALLPLVEKFFAERIFGPMRLDKLERQLRQHDRKQKRETEKSHGRLTKELAEIERRIAKQVEALEADVEPQLVGRRIAELKQQKEELNLALSAAGADAPEASFDEIAEALDRLPDLAEELRKAPAQLKRQIFDAFQLRIVYDKVGRRIEISATVSEAVAKAFENTKGLPEEAQRVAQRDIAGARYVPSSYGRIRQDYAWRPSGSSRAGR